MNTLSRGQAENFALRGALDNSCHEWESDLIGAELVKARFCSPNGHWIMSVGLLYSHGYYLHHLDLDQHGMVIGAIYDVLEVPEKLLKFLPLSN